MPYPPTTVPEFLDGILDRMETKLKTDTRVPIGLRNNVKRHAPVDDNRVYPIIYMEDGKAGQKKFASSGRKLYPIQVKLTVLIKHADPILGADQSKDACFQLVRMLTELPADQKMADANGNTLAQNVSVPDFKWGMPAKNKQNEMLWVAILEVEIEADFKN